MPEREIRLWNNSLWHLNESKGQALFYNGNLSWLHSSVFSSETDNGIPGWDSCVPFESSLNAGKGNPERAFAYAWVGESNTCLF